MVRFTRKCLTKLDEERGGALPPLAVLGGTDMARPATKYYNAHNRAGCVQIRKSRATGAIVGVYNAEQAGLDSGSGAWATVCETHNTLVNHESLALALYHAPAVIWCEYCMGTARSEEDEA